MYCLYNPETNTITETYPSVPNSHDGVYFPEDAPNDMLSPYNIYQLVEINASYDPARQIRTGPVIALNNGMVTATYTVELIPEELTLDQAKQKALADVKRSRQSGLNRCTYSAGVLAVYNENYNAALNHVAGNGSITTKNGMTSTDYCAGFGAHLGMTADQFANYIISENRRVGPTAYQIEQRYLALTYAGDPHINLLPINAMTDVDAIKQTAVDYRKFCGLE